MSKFKVGDKVIRSASCLSPWWRSHCYAYRCDIAGVFTVSGVSITGDSIALEEMAGRYEAYSFAKVAVKQDEVPVNKERNLNDLLTKLENIVDRLEKIVDGR